MADAAPVAHLLIGETLLIPHLWPIVEALAALRPGLEQDVWVATSAHEALLALWAAPLAGVRLRRAPLFRRVAADAGAQVRLPPKLPMLALLAPRLGRTRVVVCAEQTSLWLPRLLPMRARFVKTAHGVGSMSARDDPRRRAAWRMLVPSELERGTYLARGFDPARVVATGYVKAAFRQRSCASPAFADPSLPTVLYAPHWQRHRSSWWAWGERVATAIAADGRWNLIFAPHQRLAERAPEVREVAARLGALPNVHTDLESFATVDGSYTAAADVYIGDTSSQVIEFLQRPRPCVFLDAASTDWHGDASYAMWACGEVVTDPAEVLGALARAPARHPQYAAVQRDYAAAALGAVDGSGAVRAAEQALAALDAA